MAAISDAVNGHRAQAGADGFRGLGAAREHDDPADGKGALGRSTSCCVVAAPP
ncbi:MAG: hypothetical protein ACRDZ4_03545 [Egibacteraceae bacterium]